MSEIAYRFLSVEDVIELHDMQLVQYGGASGIRSRELLESAVMMPQASFGGEFVHKDIYEMAAAYAFHIAENQPFVDGNKRTALASALVFLDWHDIEIEDPEEELYSAMIDLAKKKLDKNGLAKLFKDLTI
ncbi:MAG: type II toxin-antitoxin system death-on-curing family toxin [Bdellovibrionales bacterium]|nr:type II toxin-antitoxin system death-on-curing family toxin [Bdellovibrionales bacterium]MCB0393187.1 type II toxin-antitoxin system death-on-curing family toxin [Bdellovibrionales bacterium]